MGVAAVLSRGSSPGDQGSLREHNLALVSQCVFAAGKPISRVDISDRTGLTRATVSRLVEELIQGRIVEMQEPVYTRAQGRPAYPIAPAAGSFVGIGLEINVDRLAGMAVDLQGNVRGEFLLRTSFRDSDPDWALDQLATFTEHMITEVREQGLTIAGAVLGIPGVLSPEQGIVLRAPNLGWHDVPLREMARRTLTRLGDVELQVMNDADAQSASVAYRRPGFLADPATFLYISGDMGIGGAIVTDGEVSSGVHGWAGEIGHVCVEKNGAPCFCGSRGCLERYAGLQALLEGAGLDPLRDHVPEFISAVQDKEPRALQALAEGRDALIMAISNAINILDVFTVVLGSSLSSLMPVWGSELEEGVRAMVLDPKESGLSIVAGGAVPSATALGGAMLALQGPIRSPAQWIR